MKCFSLKILIQLNGFNDSQIVPLLQRMTQLEKLTLSFKLLSRSIFLNGTCLHNEISSRMPNLQAFHFDFITYYTAQNDENLKTSDDIRRTFNQSVECYIDHFANGNSRYHIYSLPFIMSHIHSVSTKFPGGHFPNVRDLVISDSVHSIEYDFLLRIIKSFPLLKSLTIYADIPQKEKQTSNILQFRYLSKLNLQNAHISYVEQFLHHTRMSLPCLTQLQIQYDHLIQITKNFTSNQIRIICKNIQQLILDKEVVHSYDFYQYFPLL